jgi:hypothetical protein
MTNDGKLILTPELNIITAPTLSVTAGEMNYLKFPLMIGKKWPLRYSMNDRKSNYDIQATLEAHVTAYEKIRVPAGEFDAFRIEYYGKMKVATSLVQVNISSKTVAWYAPSARTIVKTESSNEYSQRILELIELQLQP